ncbi:response regulator [bacterium]|nr:response regulator [bacterium]
MQKTILIVDDEEDLTWSIARGLTRKNPVFNVLCTHSGKGALELLERHPVDLILTDIRMPEMDGSQLLLNVKNRYPNTKVIVMTAFGSDAAVKNMDLSQAEMLIEKPFEIHVLRKLIQEQLWSDHYESVAS